MMTLNHLSNQARCMPVQRCISLLPDHKPLWIRCSSTSQWPYSAATPNGVTPYPSLRFTFPPFFRRRATMSLRPCFAASCIADQRFTHGWWILQLCLIRVDTISKEPLLIAWRYFKKEENTTITFSGMSSWNLKTSNKFRKAFPCVAIWGNWKDFQS